MRDSKDLIVRCKVLRPALWGLPKQATMQLSRQMHGEAFEQVDAQIAYRVIEGIVYLLWIRSGLGILLGGALLFIGNALHLGDSFLRQEISFALILFTPAYMILLGILRLRLRGVGGRKVRDVRWFVTELGLAPWCAAIVALLAAAALS